MKKIGVIVGSVRKESYNKKIANYLVSLSTDEFVLEIIDISNLQMYNQDYDDGKVSPLEWVSFREIIRGMDGFIFVTPEYNRSLPPVLKNALDIASRPYGQNVWDGKPGAIISVSTGRLGGFGANHHLRQVATFLNISMMAQPECYLGDVGTFLDNQGHITNEAIKEMLATFLKSFQDWTQNFFL